MKLSSNFRNTLDSFPYETASQDSIENRWAELNKHLQNAIIAAKYAASAEVREPKMYETAMAEYRAVLNLVNRCERLLDEKFGNIEFAPYTPEHRMR